ncbi:hypothetical protein P9112_005136 [Eukaryota sp. TZLM1-RC]
MIPLAPVPKSNTPLTGSLWADKPFARLNVDSIGPLPPDQEANKYILVFVDSFTGYTILVPLKELNARLTADALNWNVCNLCDNGPEFAYNVFQSLCKFLSIDVTNSTPYFSQSNGLVERRHRIILQNLRKLLIDFNAYDNWAKFIPYVQLLANSFKSSVTGFSPFEVIISQCKLYHFDKPTDDEFHCSVASGDTEEHLLLEVLSQDGNECPVVYAGDVRGTEPVDRIKCTKAYQAFFQTNKSRPPAGQPTRKQPRRRARRDSRKGGQEVVLVFTLLECRDLSLYSCILAQCLFVVHSWTLH